MISKTTTCIAILFCLSYSGQMVVDTAAIKYRLKMFNPTFQKHDTLAVYSASDSAIKFMSSDLLISQGVANQFYSWDKTWRPVYLDYVENLLANKTFTMANKTLTWTFTNPSGGMNWNFTGAAAGHSLNILQTGGNPGTDMHMLHVEAEDPDPTTLHLSPGADTSRAIKIDPHSEHNGPGRFNINSTGKISWGDGTNPVDIFLIRQSSGRLRVGGVLSVDGNIYCGSVTNNGMSDSVIVMLGGKFCTRGLAQLRVDMGASTPQQIQDTIFKYVVYDGTFGNGAAVFTGPHQLTSVRAVDSAKKAGTLNGRTAIHIDTSGDGATAAALALKLDKAAFGDSIKSYNKGTSGYIQKSFGNGKDTNSIITDDGTTATVNGIFKIQGSAYAIVSTAAGNALRFLRDGANYIQAVAGASSSLILEAYNTLYLRINGSDEVTVGSNGISVTDTTKSRVIQSSSLNASQSVATDANRNLVSVARVDSARGSATSALSDSTKKIPTAFKYGPSGFDVSGAPLLLRYTAAKALTTSYPYGAFVIEFQARSDNSAQLNERWYFSPYPIYNGTWSYKSQRIAGTPTVKCYETTKTTTSLVIEWLISDSAVVNKYNDVIGVTVTEVEPGFSGNHYGTWETDSYTTLGGTTNARTFLVSDSTLDADLLDGQHGSYYLSRANHTGTQDTGTINGWTTRLTKADTSGHGSINASIATKQNTITGAATSIASSNLTASRVLVSDGSGKVAASSVTSTTLGYVDPTSSIQTQLNGKEPTVTGSTADKVWTGIKTWITLNVAAVSGLADSLATKINGSLTAKYIPIATGLKTIGNSQIQDSASVRYVLSNRNFALSRTTTDAEMLFSTSTSHYSLFADYGTDLFGLYDYTIGTRVWTALDGIVSFSRGSKISTADASYPFYVTRSGGITQGLVVHALDRDLYTTYMEDNNEPSVGNWHFVMKRDGAPADDWEFMKAETNGDLGINADSSKIVYIGTNYGNKVLIGPNSGSADSTGTIRGSLHVTTNAKIDGNAEVLKRMILDTLLQPSTSDVLRIGRGSIGSYGPLVIDQGSGASVWIGNGTTGSDRLYINNYIELFSKKWRILEGTSRVWTFQANYSGAVTDDINLTATGVGNGLTIGHDNYVTVEATDTLDAVNVNHLGRTTSIPCSLKTNTGTTLVAGNAQILIIGNSVTINIPNMTSTTGGGQPLLLVFKDGDIPQCKYSGIALTIPVLSSGSIQGGGIMYRNGDSGREWIIYQNNGGYITANIAGSGVFCTAVQFISNKF